MRLIDRILSEENIKAAIKAVKQNKGAAGIDKMPVEELEHYFYEHSINFNIKSATFYQINMHNICRCFTEDE